MSIDWNTVENKYQGNFKDYAPEGDFTTTVESVELVKASTGNTGIRFNLKETEEYKFPKYGVTFYNTKNDSWRQHHIKELFVVLGMTEDQARKSVEMCEGKDDVMDAYQKIFTKFLPKQKPVDIVVFKVNPSDQYPTWDFKSNKVRMTRPESEKAAKESSFDDPISGAEEVDLSEEMLPF